jgi:hypothetical protein
MACKLETEALLYILARFRVADYAVWKAAFDGHVEARFRHGALGHRVFRSEDDESALTVLIELTSRGGALGLTQDDVSTLCAIREGGVEGGPHGGHLQIDYLDQVDASDYAYLA